MDIKEILDNPIIKRTIEQQKKGIRKYGETVNPDSYDIFGWLDHLAEELTDAQVYIECIREKLKEKEKAAT
jgi:hypothetical protein